MTRDADRRTDPADVTVLLAAKAAVLEGRLGVLREAIDEVNARINAVSEKIRRLPAAVDHEAPPADEGAPRGSLRPRPAVPDGPINGVLCVGPPTLLSADGAAAYDVRRHPPGAAPGHRAVPPGHRVEDERNPWAP